MSDFRGDYTGFTYNGVHSSDLGIVRTSDGSRFNENLLPTMQDKTVQVPGGDGTYYFGSYFTQRQMTVSFAFDGLTEERIAEMRRLFGDKKIHNLVFDETPYKTYRAKVTGTATLKYIPFAEGETNRLFKGEGSIQFTCYQPYAVCEKKWLDEYDNSNKQEWSQASGLALSTAGYDVVVNSNTIRLYNPGDIDSHFQLTIEFKDGKIPASKMYISTDVNKQLSWSEFSALEGDQYVKFNSKLNLIEGYNSALQKTGNIYNQHISGGAFFLVPQGNSSLVVDKSEGTPIVVGIEYNYYYF